jgi:Ca2+/Na+ antiporter
LPIFFILEKRGGGMGLIGFIWILAMALVSGVIAAVIWSTVFIRSRRNGWILLAVLVFLSVNQIINAFQLSAAVGSMLLLIYTGFALLAVHRVKTRQTQETSGN